jgi:alpha-ketoglutarate-dependent taurine dioxygenase
MKYAFLNQNKLPLVIAPDSAEADIQMIVGDNRDELQALILDHGALLFRGFRVKTVPEFAAFASGFADRKLLDYVGGASPRVILGDGVYASTEYPPEISIPAHNELSYTCRWPEFLFFYCVTPPQIGGETPLGDSRRILQTIDPEIVERFSSRQIRYDRFLENDATSEYSWQAAFETEDRKLVDDYCKQRGIETEWNDDGSLRLTEIRPATAIHPKTGDEVWFNQADGFHPSVLGIKNSEDTSLRLRSHFGDGGENRCRRSRDHSRSDPKRTNIFSVDEGRCSRGR